MIRQHAKNNHPPYRYHAPASRNAGALPKNCRAGAMVGRGIEAACCFFVLARYLLFKQGYRFHMTCLWKHIHYSSFNQFITQFVNQDSRITGER